MSKIRRATSAAQFLAIRRTLRRATAVAVAALLLSAAAPSHAQTDRWVFDGQTTGPVTNSGTLDFLWIINGSVINGDVTNTVEGEIGQATAIRPSIEIRDSEVTGALDNAGRVESGGVGILLDRVMLGGGIVNSGSIDADGMGIFVINIDTLDGGIVNSGSIDSEFVGIGVGQFDTFSGGIVNSGSIDSGSIDSEFVGIGVGQFDTFGGGIVNSGSIINENGNGISVNSFGDSTFEGGIVNSGSIVAKEGDGISFIRGYGISLVEIDTFSGGIVNSGSIDADGVGIFVINIDTFDGGIVNSGSIDADVVGIHVVNIDIFGGGIVNSASIVNGDGNGIAVFGFEDINTFDGGIVNSGLIDVGNQGIAVVGIETFSGGIVNSGSIDARLNGINVGSFRSDIDTMLTFGGGIVNSGSIDAWLDGIYVGEIDTFGGGIDNTGSIVSRGATGINVSAAGAVTAAITNSGQIHAAEHGIFIGTPVSGGVWNSGTINGVESAIYIADALGASTVINLTDGAVYGDILLSGTESDTVNISGGMMDGNIDGTKGPRDDTVNFLLNGNTVVFGGGIVGVDRMFVGPGTLILKGSITDAANLVLGETAQLNTDTYTQNPSTTLGFIVGPDGTHGQLTADRVNLAGDLQILLDAGPTYPDSLTFDNVVNWTTRNGTFNSIASESLFLVFKQSYGPSSLSVTRERIPFNAYGQTANRYAVGTGIERGYRYPAPNAEAVAFYAPLFDISNAADYVAFLDAVSGSTHANALQATIHTSQVVNQAVQQRFDRVDGAMTVATTAARSLWVQALGVWGDGDSDRSAAGFDQTTGGAAFGLDYQRSDENLIGLLGAYLTDEVDFDQGRGKTEIDTWQIGAYGQYDTETWYANGILTYGWSDHHSKRRIAFQSVSDYAKSDYDGTAFVLYGEAGYKYPVGDGITLKPLLGLGYVRVDTDGFTENGRSHYNLRVKGGSGESLTSNLGARASLERTTGNGTLITVDARLLWQHEFQHDHQSVDASFAAVPDTSFSVSGSKFGRDSAIFGLGIKAQVAENSELFLNWNGKLGGDYTANSLFAGARLYW